MNTQYDRSLTRSMRGIKAGTLSAEVFLEGLGGELPELLTLICSSPAWLEQVARSSYEHVLGFTKVVLLSAYPEFQLRLHHWASPNSPPYDLHDHRFDFSSYIVNGRITNTLYEVTDCQRGAISRAELFEAAPLQARQWRRVPQRPQVFLRRGAEATYVTGATYSMRSVDIHSSRVDEPHTVTLLFEGRHSAPGSHVYPARRRRPELTTPQRPLEPTECRAVLDEVVRSIRSRSPDQPRRGTDA